MAQIRHYIRRIFNSFGLEIRRYRPQVVNSDVSNQCDTSQGKVNVTSFAWGTITQLFDFIDRKLYMRWDLDAKNYDALQELVEKHKWGLKGFGYSLVVDAVHKLHLDRKQKLRILDVGGGGSALSRVLSEMFADQCWVIDDFGIESNDQKTASWYGPNFRETLATKNPMVRFIAGRLGATRIEELKAGSFDLIYSISTLEHIPAEMRAAVFDHMFELLTPEGVMVHTLDIVSPEFPSWQNFLISYFKTRGVAPTTFMIKNLNELSDEDPPLLESADIIYSYWGNHPKNYRRMGTLVLELHRCDTSSSISQQ